MTHQIPLSENARADEGASPDGSHEIAPDLAYLRLMIVNAVLVGTPVEGSPWVLIDAGLPGTAATIKAAAEARFGLGAKPQAIVLTHGHFDHVGVLERLAEEWDVPVYAHPLERPYLDGTASYPEGDPTVGGGLLALGAQLFPTSPVNVSDRLRDLPSDGTVPVLPGWRWLHTPGHSPGHVSFFREADRALIVGDAFVTTKQESAYAALLQTPEMHGPPQYFTIDWVAARRSVEALAALEPNLAITGHGRAMQGGEMRSALSKLAREFDAVAVPTKGRYVAKPARVEDGTAYRPS